MSDNVAADPFSREGAASTATSHDANGYHRPDEEVLLKVNDLKVSFPTDDGLVEAVRGVSYEVRRNEVLGIVGESGSGKSVSTMALMGLLPKTARITGSAHYLGDELIGRPDREIRKLRGRRIAMIFQDPMTSLNPVYTIGKQLAEAVLAHHRVAPKIAMERAIEMLDLVGIPQARKRAASYPHEFSGGMRQRVMIAMAIINDPDILIADEPTTALDVTVQAQILETLLEVKDQVGAAIVLITHDLGVIAGTADRVGVMYAGRFVEMGGVDDVFKRSRMPYTAGLLGSVPELEADVDELLPIPGAPPTLINPPNACMFRPRCPIARAECAESEPLLFDVGEGHRSACHFWQDLELLERPSSLFDRSRTEVTGGAS